MPSPDFDSLSDAVEQRVLEILDLDEAEQEEALEALYRTFPEQAEAIRAWLRGMDRGRDGSVLHSDAGSSSSWRELVEQLRSRGPAWTRYVFEGEIARGGMGVVHRVRDQDAHRSLALKVILGQGEAAPTGDTPPVDDRSLGRFLEEAQVASQLDHPGIVPVHEIGVDGEGRVYFTMKLVQGQDLRAVFDMARTGRDGWSETRGLNVLLRVCEAMAYAHAKGVIHRDLKPANVMVGKFGEVYVMDWGLARVLDRKDDRASPTRDPSATVDRVKSDRKARAEDTPDTPLVTMDGDVVGTPSYMPPEQAEGRLRDIGPASDVYAVGAMLYHLLAGQMPYVTPGEPVSPHSLLTTVVERPPEPLSELRRDVTPELLAIVEKAMARDLADRYPDMTALAWDLRAFLENRVVAAYETGAWAELKKWVLRNKALAGTTAAAVVLLAGLGTWFNFRIRAERDVAIANKEEADAQRDRADTERKTAEAERDRVLRLSDVKKLNDLVLAMDHLWPAHPEKIPSFEAWLDDADALLQNLPDHESTLTKLRSSGTPGPHGRAPELATLKTERAELAAKRDAASDDEERTALVDQLQSLEQRIVTLEATIARERPHEFADTQDGWWHDTLVGLISGLYALKADEVHGETRASVAQRLTDAETIRRRSIGDHRREWDEAIAAIGSSPKYSGLQMTGQLGLVPIGADPESGLREFWHVPTGDRPSRDEETGALKLTEATGLVFVLIPGGKYRIGAQKEDEDKPHYDPLAEPDESPVHEVTLSPYFLSKYEMTQGQWARFTGKNPSNYRPKSAVVKTLRHPVEQVNWEMCGATLSRLDLVLPTERQWEAACRAGTETPWSTGRERESLEGFANLADQAAKRAGATWPGIEDWPELDDGFVVHAPVGSYRANAFGLHDMHGNVYEWCRDGYSGSADESLTPNEGDGLCDVPGALLRVGRSGGFLHRASFARSAIRYGNTPEIRYPFLGLRPARILDP